MSRDADAPSTASGVGNAPVEELPDAVTGETPAASSGARILVVDNYDSFAYNLVQYVGTVAGEVIVRRNDAVDRAGVEALDPDGIVVSPGPGAPAEAGVSVDVFRTDYPALGVCLGHQALCAAHGAPVERAPSVVHGKASLVEHDGRGVFAGLDSPLRVGRYHSLAVHPWSVEPPLEPAAWTAGPGEESEPDRGDGSEPATGDPDGGRVLMAVRHRERPHVGVQFHPESVLTEAGLALVRNFCASCRPD